MIVHRKQIRSYVIRKGRISDGQRRALAELWDQYGLESSDGLIDPSAQFETDQAVTIEIGFGMGDSLVQMAAEDPTRNFIGMEVHTPGIGHLLREADERGLTNLKVYSEDSIGVFEQCIPDESIACVQIFFPDPWPKKRHHKRRLIQGEFLGLILPRLKRGGILHIATDWEPYAEWIRELLHQHDGFVFADAPVRPNTKYELRGLGLGHSVTDIAARKA